jgi:hypothetical protein
MKVEADGDVVRRADDLVAYLRVEDAIEEALGNLRACRRSPVEVLVHHARRRSRDASLGKW